MNTLGALACSGACGIGDELMLSSGDVVLPIDFRLADLTAFCTLHVAAFPSGSVDVTEGGVRHGVTGVGSAALKVTRAPPVTGGAVFGATGRRRQLAILDRAR